MHCNLPSYLSFAQQDGLLWLLCALLVQQLDDGVEDVGSLLHVPDLDVQATPLQLVGRQAPVLSSTVIQALQGLHGSDLHASAVKARQQAGQTAGAAQALARSCALSAWSAMTCLPVLSLVSPVRALTQESSSCCGA